MCCLPWISASSIRPPIIIPGMENTHNNLLLCWIEDINWIDGQLHKREMDQCLASICNVIWVFLYFSCCAPKTVLPAYVIVSFRYEYFNHSNCANQSKEKTERCKCVNKCIYVVVYVCYFVCVKEGKRLLFCHASSSDKQKIRVLCSREILASWVPITTWVVSWISRWRKTKDVHVLPLFQQIEHST